MQIICGTITCSTKLFFFFPGVIRRVEKNMTREKKDWGERLWMESAFVLSAETLFYVCSVSNGVAIFCVCACVWASVSVCFLLWMYLALPVHRDELNLSKSSLAVWCVFVCDVLRCIGSVYGHVCFKACLQGLCILHENTVLYVSNPFVCPNVQWKHKHSADPLFVKCSPTCMLVTDVSYTCTAVIAYFECT